MRVLLVVDGSPAGTGAIRIAQELLAGRPVTITVLYVMPGSRLAPTTGTVARDTAVRERRRLAGAQLLNQSADVLRQAGVGPCILTQLDMGDAVASIVAALDATRPDLLVLGHGQATGERRLGFKRSRWDRLIACARCPVLVARAPRLVT